MQDLGAEYKMKDAYTYNHQERKFRLCRILDGHLALSFFEGLVRGL